MQACGANIIEPCKLYTYQMFLNKKAFTIQIFTISLDRTKVYVSQRNSWVKALAPKKITENLQALLINGSVVSNEKIPSKLPNCQANILTKTNINPDSKVLRS